MEPPSLVCIAIQVPGKTWVPAKCCFFLWLLAHKRCGTSDCLARRGLPHPEKCPLCDQANKSIGHLLIACVFLKAILVLYNTSFDDWWAKASAATIGLTHKGLNSLIVLGAWIIWNHQFITTAAFSMEQILT